MAKVTFRNLPSEETEFIDVPYSSLLRCAYEYARLQNDELYEVILQRKICLDLNGITVPSDCWYIIEIFEEDEIVIRPSYHGDFGEGLLQIGIGIFFIAAAIFAPYTIGILGFSAPITAGSLYVLGASFILGGISSLLFQPDLPALGSFNSGAKSTATYNWSGIKLTARNDIPIPVVYGTHKIGGNLISVFTEGLGIDNYIYMLIALCEGEIDGIAKDSDHSAVCTTTNTTDTSNYYDPAIEINDIPMKELDNVEWWYRTGTNSDDSDQDQYYPFVQNKIPYFEGSKIQNDDGRTIDTTGIIYTTTKEVDRVLVQLRAPSLVDASGQEVAPAQVYYRIYYRTEDEPSWHSYQFTTYSIVRTSVLNSTGYWDASYVNDLVYISYIAPKYRMKILSNTFNAQTMTLNFLNSQDYSYTIKVEVTNTQTGNIHTETVVNSASPASWLQPDHHYTKIVIGGIYKVWFYHNIPVGAIMDVSCSAGGTSVNGNFRGQSKTGLWSGAELDFNSLPDGSGKDTYLIKVARLNPESTDLQINDTIQLHSITEIVNGDFIYPNTALLALKIKATGQLHGSIPNVTSIVRGKKISVPDIAGGSEAFDEVWYDSTDERFENSDGEERTWDESTYTEEWSDNAILCVRDLVLNKRFGLGQYVKNSDLDADNIVSLIKECHTSYDPYEDNQPDYMAWYSGGFDDQWDKKWWTVLGVVSSDKSARTISFVNDEDTIDGYRIGFNLNMPLSKYGTYTLSITLSGLSTSVNIQGLASISGSGWVSFGTLTNKGNGTHTIDDFSINVNKVSAIILTISKNNSNVVGNLTGNITDVSLTGTLSEHYHTFNGVLESQQSALTVLLETCNAFRCWPIWSNGGFTFILDKNDTAVHEVSMGNIVEGSFSQTFTEVSDIPYSVEGQFTDESLDYELRSLVLSSNQSDLNRINKQTIGLKGITDRQKAERELRFRLNKLINCNHIINFKCGLDYLHGTAGDIIAFSHDLPAIGDSGRVLSYTATQIILDKEVDFTDSNATYTIRYQNIDNQFSVATVNATGNLQEVPINALPASPCDNGVYIAGRSSTSAKPFRLVSVQRSQEDEVEVIALNHVASVYTEPEIKVFDDKYSTLSIGTNDTTKDIPIKPLSPQGAIVSRVPYSEGIGFQIDVIYPVVQSNITDTVVEMSTGANNDYNLIAIIPLGSSSTKYINNSLQLNTTYYFKVYHRNGSVYSNPIYVQHYLDAISYQIDPPSGLYIKGSDPLSNIWNGKDITITWNPVAIGGNTDIVNGYLIEVYKNNYNPVNRLRGVFVQNTEFTYTYSMNIEDNLGIPTGDLAFVVYSRTVNGLISNTFAGPFVVTNANPTAPSNVIVTSSKTGLQVSWKNNTDYLENDIKNREIYRSRTSTLQGGSPLELESGANLELEDDSILELEASSGTTGGLNATLVATVPSNLTSYADNSVPVKYDTPYYYWVKAVDYFSNESDYSSVASARLSQVTGTDITASTITGNHMAAKTITAREIQANTITATEIKSISITASDIAASSITARELRSGTILGDNINAVFNISGKTVTADTGVIGGFELSSTQIRSSDGKIVIDSNAKAISLNSSIWQEQGVQIQYNSGTPRIYAGDGSTKYFQFDGTDITYANGQILEAEMRIYTSGVIKTNAAPATNGGLIIDNTSINGYSATQTKFLEIIYNGASAGEIYLGDQSDRHLKFTATSLQIKYGSTVLSDYGNDITIGEVAASKNNIYISSGAIALRYNTDNIISINASGVPSIDITAGGDITFNAASDNPSALNFVGASRIYRVQNTYNNDLLAIFPDTDGVGGFYLGYDTDGATYKRFQEIYFSSYTQLFLQAQYTTNYRNSITLHADTVTPKQQVLVTTVYNGNTNSFDLYQDGSSRMARFNASTVRPYSDSKTILGHPSYCWTDVRADAGVTSCSDVSFKTILGPEILGLEFVNKLPWVQYKLNKGGKTRKKIMRGLVGQELEQTLIDTGYDPKDFDGLDISKRVITDEETGKDIETNEDIYGIRYDQFIPIIGKALQEKHSRDETRFNDIEARLKALENK